MGTLRIDNEFKNLLPPLTETEFSELEKDIKEHGVLSPIITWNGFIIDGHNRYQICKKNNIPLPEVRELEFANKSDVMSWIISYQTGRRNLTKSQLVRAYAHVEEQLKREAQARMLSGKKDLGANLPQGSEKNRNARPTETIAKELGVSRKTYEGMRTIVSEGTTEQVERMDKGGKGNGVSAIVAEIKDKKLNENIPEGYKRCSRCKRILPLTEFYKQCDTKSGYRAQCKDCARNSRDSSAWRIPLEKTTKIDPSLRGISKEEIEGDLYERKTMGFDNVVDEVSEIFKACMASFDNICRMNGKALEDPANRKIIYGKIMELKKQVEDKEKEFGDG